MKKLTLLALMVFATGVAYAANNSKIELRGSVDDGNQTILSSGLITKYFSSGATQVTSVSLDSNSTTNVSVPNYAKAVLIDVMTADGIKLKGVTGDVGISLDDTCPILLPLSSDVTNTIAIQNLENNSNRVTVYFY